MFDILRPFGPTEVVHKIKPEPLMGADVDLKSRRGRPKQCLPSALRQDVQKAGFSLQSSNGLEELHSIASDIGR